MLIKNRCFCGSDKSFASCCQPYLSDDQTNRTLPETPEQLMRSRFSAYANGNSQYIYDTYAKSSQAAQTVAEINDWSEACLWIALQIHSTSNIGIINVSTINDASLEKDLPEQFVEFSAFYIADDTLFELRENSRFILEKDDKNGKQKSQWRYIDGNILKHDKVTTIKRKDLCPCNNYPTAWSIKKGKKFKQCCGS